MKFVGREVGHLGGFGEEGWIWSNNMEWNLKELIKTLQNASLGQIEAHIVRKDVYDVCIYE